MRCVIAAGDAGSPARVSVWGPTSPPSRQTPGPPIKPDIVQPANADEQGQWINAGWNKLVYDPDGKRVLFNDRWHDKKHGGTTIYGNCLFSFDPATAKLVPLKLVNWTKTATPSGGYRTPPLPENDKEPTPCPRHVYHGFDYVSELKAIFICNGANQSAMLNDKVLGHDLCADTWRYDLEKKTWTKIGSKEHPPNRLEDGMAYCPDIKALVYAGQGKIWIMDLATGEWRKAKTDLPRYHMGMTVFYDAPRKRMLLVKRLWLWQSTTNGRPRLAGSTRCTPFRSLDGKNHALPADCPTALCRACSGSRYETRSVRYRSDVDGQGRRTTVRYVRLRSWQEGRLERDSVKQCGADEGRLDAALLRRRARLLDRHGRH